MDSLRTAIRFLRRDWRAGELRLLATAHVAREELALAEDALKKAIELAPDNPAAYLQLAEMRFRSGDTEGASIVLEKLLARVPDNAAAQSALARIQLSQRDWEAMKVTAERMTREAPDRSVKVWVFLTDKDLWSAEAYRDAGLDIQGEF